MMQGRTRCGAVLTVVGMAVVLTACAAAPNEATAANGPGFWLGLWQGFIAPVTFILSLFRDDVGVYAVNNSGGWYDFGFLLGASMIFSGGGAAGSRRA